MVVVNKEDIHHASRNERTGLMEYTPKRGRKLIFERDNPFKS